MQRELHDGDPHVGGELDHQCAGVKVPQADQSVEAGAADDPAVVIAGMGAAPV